jgi:plastocyanin
MINKFGGIRNFLLSLLLIVLLIDCTSADKKRQPEVHTIVIRQMKFQPDEMTVQRGDTVVWVNEDLVVHDVTEEANKSWSSSPLPVGLSWRMEVTESVNYFCSIHLVMKGKLIVKQSQ